MRTVVVAVAGASLSVAAARAARRGAVVERLEPARLDVTRLVPGPLRRRLERACDAAALDVTVSQALHIAAGVMIATAMLVAAVTGSLAATIGAAAVVAVALPVALFAARGRRSRAVAAEVPAMIERVASELRAGGTIATAVSGIARSGSLLAADCARMGARMSLGASLTDALHLWARERPAPGVDVAAGAFAMCATLGGRSADALEGVASSLRDRLAVAAEARAQSAQARMSALVVGGMPVLYIGWSAIADRRAFVALTGTPVGRVCVAVGITLEVLGVLWIRRILRHGSAL